MPDDRDVIRSVLDEMALCVMTMEPDDIQSLGVILNSFDKIHERAPNCEPEPWNSFGQALRGIAEKMVLFEVESPDGALADLGRGLALWQETCDGECGDHSGRTRIQQFLDECPLTNGASEDKAGQPAGDARDGGECAAPGDMEQDRELIESFIQEAREHLESIEIHVLDLEKNPENTQLVDAIFRPFHTIKGVSGFLNFQDINHLAHEVETVLDDARNRRISVSPDLVDLVLDSVDMMTQLIDAVGERLETGAPPGENPELAAFLDRVTDTARRKQAEAAAREQEPSSPDGNEVGEILLREGLVAPEDLREALVAQGSQDDPKKRLGEILIKTKKASARNVAKALRKQKTARTGPAGGGNGAAGGGFIKVDTAKLDNMVDMVGELVINEAMVSQRAGLFAGQDRELSGNLAQLGRITSEIQRIAMSMRMIPMKTTFQKMIRLVRDLSAKARKQVSLEMMGEDTEIDRNMVDMIYDPLVHMVRNSVDHGLETPGERTAAGKPETGTILLNAHHKGGAMIIEVTDDGRGLNREAIVAKALEKGMIQSPETMSDQDVFGLIFHPGFSTAKTITDVSGRGVGMDVVKGVLDKLRGKVEVDSRPGRGTTILMKLPLTLAVIDGIIARAGQQSYVMPTVSVLESIRPSRNECHTVVNQGEMITIRGNLYPLIRLHDLFDFEPVHWNPWNAIVVIAESEGKRKCILVDEILGKQEVVIKSLSGMLKNVQGLAGGAILANGRVGMILDVAGLFALSERQAAGAVREPDSASETPP